MRARKLLALGVRPLALGLVAGCGDDESPAAAPARAEPRRAAAAARSRSAFLSDCEGAFGSFFEPTAAGFNRR